MKEKRNLLLLSIAVFFTLNSIEAQSSKGPVMNFAETTYDFGSVVENSKLSTSFKFINDGTESLIIKQVKNSKFCSVVDYPRKGVEPGNTAEIKVNCKINSVASEDELIAIRTNAVNGSSKKKIGIFELRIIGKVKKK